MLTVEPSIWVVIPAKNESASIGAVVTGVREQGRVVLVVDDGSEDDTQQVARAAGAQVLPLATSLGAWGATQAGLRYAYSKDARTVVTLDADGQHPVERVSELVRCLARSDIAIGSDPSRVSLKRRFAWGFLRRLSGLDVTDLTSGYRAYGPRAMKLLVRPEATLLNYQDIGVLLMARRANLSVTEMPVKMAPREIGASRVFASWFKVMLYLLESSIISLANLGNARAGERRRDDGGGIR